MLETFSILSVLWSLMLLLWTAWRMRKANLDNAHFLHELYMVEGSSWKGFMLWYLAPLIACDRWIRNLFPYKVQYTLLCSQCARGRSIYYCLYCYRYEHYEAENDSELVCEADSLRKINARNRRKVLIYQGLLGVLLWI